jgi:hypothetical protein
MKGMMAVAVFAAFTSLACAGAQRIRAEPTFWSEKQTRVGIGLAAVPPAAPHRVGAEGLLDMAINKGMAGDLEKHLASLTPSAFVPVLDQMERRLKKAGMAPKKIAEPINLGALPERANKADGYFERDVSALAARYDVDALLIVEVVQWGTLRNYYGFIPLGDPKALFGVSGRLVGRDGRMRWYDWIEGEDALLPVSGEWDQPPAFANVTRSIQSVERKAAAFLEGSLFGAVVAPLPPEAPPPAPPPAPVAASLPSTAAPAPTAAAVPAAPAPAPAPTATLAAPSP